MFFSFLPFAGEVKIKIDSCLCDACFRHVDRKANCPSYRKKTEAKSLSSLAKIQSCVSSIHDDKQSHEEIPASASAPSLDNSRSSAEESAQQTSREMDVVEEKIHGNCHVRDCGAGASHTIRRKWLLKMKKTISKILEINLEQTNAVSNLIPICDGHYELISHLMVCAMCKRRLPKNHIYYIVNVSTGRASVAPLDRRKREAINFPTFPTSFAVSTSLPCTVAKIISNTLPVEQLPSND